MLCGDEKHVKMKVDPVARRLFSESVAPWPGVGVLFTCAGCKSSFVARIDWWQHLVGVA